MRRSIIGPLFATIVLLGGLGVGGYAVYQAGYNSGLSETASEVIVQTPAFYPGFGLFFGFIFLLFLFGFISKMFFWSRWRKGADGHRRWDGTQGTPMERRLHDWHEKAHEPERQYRSDDPDLA